MTFCRTYDLNGLTISVDAPDEALGTCLDPLLAPLAATGPLEADWHVRICLDDQLPATVPGETVWDGQLLEGLRAECRQNGTQRHVLVHDHLALSMDRSRKTIDATVRPGREQTLRGSPSIQIIAEIIAGSGLHLIHAACLLFPAGDEALIIFAPSGTGKTTTSLALARAGWRLFGDDATLLEMVGGKPFAWALPRALNVHCRTEAMLPWLADATKAWGERSEQSVPLKAVESLVGIALGKARPCHTVVVLDRPNGTDHTIASMDRSEALLRILADNVRVAPDGMGDQGVSLFTSLASLVKDANLLRVSVGPDPATLGPLLAAACGKSARPLRL